MRKTGEARKSMALLKNSLSLFYFEHLKTDFRLHGIHQVPIVKLNNTKDPTLTFTLSYLLCFDES